MQSPWKTEGPVRIAIVNSTNRIIGGAERYIDESIPLLRSSGHEAALFVPQNYPASLSDIANDDVVRLIGDDVVALHSLAGIGALAAWDPDVIFVHCLLPQILEERLFSVAPSVLFAHDYVRTCISGSKTLHSPNARPCSRRLGLGCLAHYYPHRCGGLNPVTMARNYRRGLDALTRLTRYQAVVAFSAHMRAEYVRNTKGAANVVLIPPFATVPPTNHSVRSFAHAHLGFLGRLEQEKGVDLLIDALPLAADGLRRGITLTIAGRGRQKAALESQSRELMLSREDITVQFTDWVTGQALRGFFDNLDLLVIPSTWPEPFALVGLEAAARSVPAVAFSVGGIPDWLSDGFNGHLAPGARPSASGLSDAVVAALDDQTHHQRLRRGAAEVSSRYTAELHIARLTDLLGNIVVSRDANESAS